MGVNYYALVESKELYDMVMENEDWIDTKTFPVDPETPWNQTLAIHICKCSYGWISLFHGKKDTPFNSKRAWFKILKDHKVRIISEDHDILDVDELESTIETYYSPQTRYPNHPDKRPKNHFEYCLMGYPDQLRYIYNDEDGHTIDRQTFS